jgi:peptide-methionine (S)-S-oxide reductase
MKRIVGTVGREYRHSLKELPMSALVNRTSIPSRARRYWLAALLLPILAILAPTIRADEAPKALPEPSMAAPASTATVETAVLSGGCFWGMQGVYQHVKGVKQVLAGYAGGEQATASYEQVSSGSTGHAESVQITFDPKVVSYGEILRIYFSVAHDPTELNRQGPDDGTQYRSNIWYGDAGQQQVALAYIAQLQQAKVFAEPIVTRVDPLKGFYPAEAYHQDFLVNHPDYPYIVFNDLPKVANLKQLLPEDYRDTAVTVGTASQ